MANVKITQLPLATTPLTGTEVFPLVQGTTTKQVAITGLFTSPVMSNPTLGVVGQADLINATGLPISTGVAGLGTGIATFLGTPSSTNLRAAVTDETGTGALVFANAPVLVAPDLGTPSVLVATNATGTAVGLTAGSAITNANLTGAVTSVGNATSLGSFTSAQLRTALTDETGAGSAVFATSPTITAPILNQINDTNNAQILGLSPTTSAVDYLVVKNGIGTGVPLHFYADGSSANIGLHIQPKGTGLVTISDGTDFNKGIRFRSSGSAASAVTLLDAVSSAGRVVTLPDATTTLVGRDTTDTLTNKTIAFSSNTFTGALAIANGGTNASTAASAIENLLPAYAGNGSKGLRLNSGATALEWVADGGGTVTSVAASVPSFLSIAGSPITTSGTLAFTLSGTALPTTSGGTGLTSFTANGVAYASSSSALTTGSALTFDGSLLTTGGSTSGSTIEVLRLSNSGTGANTQAQLKFYTTFTNYGTISGGYGSGSPQMTFDLPNATPGLYVWQIVGSTALTLTSTSLYTASGINVGIGHSNPTQKLDVSGSGVISARITSTSSNATLILNSASAFYNYLSYTSAGSGGLILYDTTNSANRVILDSAGNLGLGIAPSAWDTLTALQVKNASLAAFGNSTYLYSNAYYQTAIGNRYISDGFATRYTQGSGKHIWETAPSSTANATATFTEAMTLDASSRLSVGTTSALGQGTFSAGSNRNGLWVENDTYDYQTLTLYNKADANDNIFAKFGTESSSFNSRGSITYNRAGGLVAYNTTSDYRAKDISGPVTGSGLLIDSVPVYMGKMKGATQERPMFIAHEVPAYAHTGEKDAVDADGNPVYQQMDASALIPVMWAEIQSLRQRVAQLETN